jgi:Superfamily II DNA and RNA helicases
LLSLQQFEDFGLDKSVLRGIFRAGYVRPTQVQSRVIPLLLKGKSVLVQSKTGTGKTAAFAIPILEWISENSFPHLVLAPTRELAEQVSQEFERLGQVKVATIIGGVPITPQFSTLKNHIVVGTPGRTLDHVRRGKLKLESFKTVIIDEVDRLLDMGFVEDVEKVIKGAKTRAF